MRSLGRVTHTYSVEVLEPIAISMHKRSDTSRDFTYEIINQRAQSTTSIAKEAGQAIHKVAKPPQHKVSASPT